MHILIIGCGYIGSALGQSLIDEGHQVTGVIRTPDSAEQLKSLGIKPIIADCSTPSGAEMACEAGADMLVFSISSRGAPRAGARGTFGFGETSPTLHRRNHAGSFGEARAPVRLRSQRTTARHPHSSTDGSQRHSAEAGGGDYQKTYFDGMRNVLSALKQSPSLFFYTSSTSVYAQTNGEWVTEQSETSPTQENGKILLKTEQQLRTAAEGKFQAYILRLSGIYGPGRHAVLDQLRKSTDTLSGHEKQWINQIHRDDVVSGIRFLMSQPRSTGCSTFNVTDNTPIQRSEYVEWICKKLGRPVPKFTGESRSTNRRISNESLRKLGWIPKYPGFQTAFDSL